MKSQVCVAVIVLLLSVGCAESKTTSQKGHPGSSDTTGRRRVVVPESASRLVRPLLDLREESTRECTPSTKCSQGDPYRRKIEREEKFEGLLYKLIDHKGADADEALVVLMCFYIGESQEEADEVIRRGRHMLKYLSKYRHATPSIPNRNYPGAMFRTPQAQDESIEGAITAIKRGLRGTWDDLER